MRHKKASGQAVAGIIGSDHGSVGRRDGPSQGEAQDFAPGAIDLRRIARNVPGV